jgi:hypothetical protein
VKRSPPASSLGRQQFEKTVEGICGWIPHEQVEGQSAFTN